MDANRTMESMEALGRSFPDWLPAVLTTRIVLFMLGLIIGMTGCANTKSTKPETAVAWVRATDSGLDALQLGDLDGAEAHFRNAVDLAKKFPADDVLLATSYDNLGQVYQYQGRLKDAEKTYENSLQISNRGRYRNWGVIGIAKDHLAVIYRLQGRQELSGVAFHFAKEYLEKAGGPDNPDLWISLNNLAVLRKEQGRWEDSEKLSKRAKFILKKT
jgi:tetratricopeptide (TPR) repeat protein